MRILLYFNDFVGDYISSFTTFVFSVLGEGGTVVDIKVMLFS